MVYRTITMVGDIAFTLEGGEQWIDERKGDQPPLTTLLEDFIQDTGRLASEKPLDFVEILSAGSPIHYISAHGEADTDSKDVIYGSPTRLSLKEGIRNAKEGTTRAVIAHMCNPEGYEFESSIPLMYPTAVSTPGTIHEVMTYAGPRTEPSQREAKETIHKFIDDLCENDIEFKKRGLPPFLHKASGKTTKARYEKLKELADENLAKAYGT